MRVNSISKKFSNKILLWPKDIKELKQTQDVNLIHYIDEDLKKIFTIQSVLQAILNDKIKLRYTKENKKPFYIIDYKDLVEIN